MNHVVLSEAESLLGKLLEEHTPVRVLLITTSGVRVSLPGFVDGKKTAVGIMLSVSGPPLDTKRGFLIFPLERVACWYGDERELPEAERKGTGESVLIFDFESGDKLILFFTD